MSYTESEAYQKEIAEQYKQRNLELTSTEVWGIMGKLGFDADADDIQLAEAGNMNATFLTSNYVVKASAKRDVVKYAANKIVSDSLPEEKVVRVLSHDQFKATDYEVLVMERAPGSMWLKNMPSMSEAENRILFSQVLKTAIVCHSIEFTKKFGWVTDIYADEEENGFNTFRSQLEARLGAYLPKIRAQKDVDLEALKKIVFYVSERLSIFDNDEPSFVHRDLHMGNVMHQDGELTAVIDFDSTQSVPSYTALIPLTGLIDNPAQFVEGTDDYLAYKGRKFEYLYPELKRAFTKELEDPDLALKLNVLGVIEGLMWVSEDWSQDWNKEMVTNLANKETPSDGDVTTTYFGEIIEKIRNS